MAKNRDFGKNEGYLTAIGILLYLALEQIPWQRFIGNEYIYTGILIGVRAAYCVVVYLLLRRYHCDFSGILGDFPHLLWFLPFLLLPFSNFVGGLAEGAQYAMGISSWLLLTQTFATLFLAILEEVLFRFLLFSFLAKKMPKIAALFLQAAIFGLLHLLNLFGGAGVGPTFLQVGYSFANGLVCGLMWGYGGGLILPIFYHFTFNFFEGDLFRAVYSGPNGTPVWVSNISFAAVAVIYGLLLYFLVLRKYQIAPPPEAPENEEP